MKVLGLITEYNPFHNGHLYHLEQSRKLSGADYVVCVMSGNFIQRGEPAIINKWARTQMALSAGIDVVVEIPTVFAMSSAEFFAFGAVKLLESLGIVDDICFGTESGKIEELDLIAGILNEEPAEYKVQLKQELSKGISFPSAREAALGKYISDLGHSGTYIKDLVGKSNNILGIEYLKALKRLKSSIRPLTINRITNSYSSLEITGAISSATAIRNQLTQSCRESAVRGTIPENSRLILSEEFSHGRGPVFPQDFSDMLLCLFRKMSDHQIRSLPFVSEGIENRIREAAACSGNFDELVEYISTKRYTRTRVQRILFSALAGISQPVFDEFMENGGPQYIRILGFNERGRCLISRINRNSCLPVIIKTADFKNSENPLVRKMLELEAIATDAYVLGYTNKNFKKSGQEFTQNIIRV